MSNKKRDDEKSKTILVCGLFTMVLLIADFTAGIFHLPVWLIMLEIAGHIFLAYAWYRVFVGFDDPNQDYWRKICIVVAAAALIGVMGDRATRIGKQMFNQTVEETKAR